jgi:hypothetical protein
MLFDYSKVAFISHTPQLVELANDPHNMSMEEALAAVEEFVGQYTVTRESSCTSHKPDSLDPRLRILRREMRTLKSRIRTCWREDTKEVLESQHQSLVEAYRMERDSVAAEKRAEIRARFWEAQKSGNHHLAWKQAQIGLSGKGGGVRTSSTTSVSREASQVVTLTTGPSIKVNFVPPSSRRSIPIARLNDQLTRTLRITVSEPERSGP